MNIRLMNAFVAPLIVVATMAWSVLAWADEATQPAATPAGPSMAQPIFADREIEERLKRLSAELRCVVCQNEALSDSPADLAESMRQEIRDLMRSGMTDRQVVDFLVARYGDFVLFRPPFKPLTYLLWLGPFLFLGFGVLIWFVALRERRDFKSAPVSSEHMAAAARLLEDKK